MANSEITPPDTARLKKAISEQEEDIDREMDSVSMLSEYHSVVEDAKRFAVKSAQDAADFLAKVEFDDPRQREAIIDKFIALFDVNDAEINGIIENYEGRFNVEKERCYQLIQREIAALEFVGVVIPEQIAVYAMEPEFLFGALTGEDLDFKKGFVPANTVLVDTVEKDDAAKWLGDINEAQREFFRISEIEWELQQKYGFDVMYGKTGILIDLHENADLPTLKEISAAYSDFQRIMEKYPPDMIRSAGLRHVLLVSDFRSDTGEELFAGMALDFGNGYYGDIVIDLDDGLEWSLDHELNHRLDQRDDSKADDKKWASVNPRGMASYEYESGYEAIKNTDEDEEYAGFANEYGMLGGPDEDQATVAEQLLKPAQIKGLFARCIDDEVLRNKVEIMTGCEFNILTGRFSRMFTVSEYSTRFGFVGYQYYAKWSARPQDGCIMMDHIYWNSLADGLKPSFVLKNGKWLIKYSV